jgi:Zn-dependent M28 family amino/carboxypeptidase
LKVAAKDIGHPNVISKDRTPIEDDTVPFARRGVPVLDVIDYDYGPHTNQTPDGYHHTAQDTLDKISPQSLQIAGELFLELIRLVDQR